MFVKRQIFNQKRDERLDRRRVTRLRKAVGVLSSKLFQVICTAKHKFDVHLFHWKKWLITLSCPKYILLAGLSRYLSSESCHHWLVSTLSCMHSRMSHVRYGKQILRFCCILHYLHYQFHIHQYLDEKLLVSIHLFINNSFVRLFKTPFIHSLFPYKNTALQGRIWTCFKSYLEA